MTLPAGGKGDAACVCNEFVVGAASETGMTCNPYNGLLLLLPGGASLIGTSISEPAEVVLALCGRLFRPFRLSPSLAPIFFHPLLCALIARCRLLGDVETQSEVGGVVGGVMGSFPDGDPVLPVSSESPTSRSTGSPDDEPDLFPWSFVHDRLSMGRKPTFGDRLDSSAAESEEASLGMRTRFRGCLASSSSSTNSGEGAATEARKGPNTLSFMSS